MTDFKKLAGELARESIVTMALARFLEQVIQTIHEEEIEPLRREVASLREANNTWVALYGPVPGDVGSPAGGGL